MAVVLVATLDTKGQEAGFLDAWIKGQGLATHVIDAGCQGNPSYPADTPREAVFQAANTTLARIRASQDRGLAVNTAAAGVATIVDQLHRQGQVDGIIGIGGSAGTTIATAAMRVLPVGLPKVMLSTMASGQVRPYVGAKDMTFMHSVADIAGLNRITRTMLRNAAAALVGMITLPSVPPSQHQPLITATMFGVTTPCIDSARRLLEQADYEVVVFHAVGSGGQAMETLIADGWVTAVLDVTTTELADELVGGVLSAGPDRLLAAGRAGIPQVVSLGALDMVNFGPRDTLPQRFDGRLLYVHNANVTLMRTTPEENEALGNLIADKLNQANGPTALVIPRGGLSALDRPGQPFHDPAADAALFTALERRLASHVERIDSPCHINDSDFATLLVDTVQRLLKR